MRRLSGREANSLLVPAALLLGIVWPAPASAAGTASTPRFGLPSASSREATAEADAELRRAELLDALDALRPAGSRPIDPVLRTGRSDARRPAAPRSRCRLRPTTFFPLTAYLSAASGFPPALRAEAIRALTDPVALARVGLPLANSIGNPCGCTPSPNAPYADVSVTKGASAATLVAGNPLSWTLVVRNTDANASTSVTLSDSLPAGVTFGSVSPGSPTCSHSAGVVSCNLGTLSPGAMTSVTIHVTVNSNFAGTLTNTASVDGSQTDPVLSNDTASASTTVIAPAVGSAPDGTTPAAPLLARKSLIVPTQVDLSWGASCGTLTSDYSVHEGSLASLYSHDAALCSTVGGFSATLTPNGSDRYWLIVPISPTAEGSYGTATGGAQIPPSPSPCRVTQDLGSCL